MFALLRRAAVINVGTHRPACLDVCLRSLHWGGPGEGRVSYLPNPVTGAELYLVGTAHVSSKSVEEVKEVIDMVKPNVVAVELCEERANSLMQGTESTTLNIQGTFQEFLKYPGGLGQKLLHIFFKIFYQTMREAGLEPGMEFKVAMDEANNVGAELVLMDQNYKETIERLKNALSIWDILKFVSRMGRSPTLAQSAFKSHEFKNFVEELKTREAARQMRKWLENEFPNLYKVMLHERDLVMVRRLCKCEGKVVGVVGIAHMDGIEQLWQNRDFKW